MKKKTMSAGVGMVLLLAKSLVLGGVGGLSFFYTPIKRFQPVVALWLLVVFLGTWHGMYHWKSIEIHSETTVGANFPFTRYEC